MRIHNNTLFGSIYIFRKPERPVQKKTGKAAPSGTAFHLNT